MCVYQLYRQFVKKNLPQKLLTKNCQKPQPPLPPKANDMGYPPPPLRWHYHYFYAFSYGAASLTVLKPICINFDFLVYNLKELSNWRINLITEYSLGKIVNKLDVFWTKYILFCFKNFKCECSISNFFTDLDHQTLSGQVYPPSWWCFRLWSIVSKCMHFVYAKLARWNVSEIFSFQCLLLLLTSYPSNRTMVFPTSIS